MDTVWMQKYKNGEPDPTVPPKEVEGRPDVLFPLMNTGWHQCEAPNPTPAQPAAVKESLNG